MNSLPARRPDVSRSLLIWQKDSSVNSHINVMFGRCRITHSIFFRYTSQLLLTETRFSTEFGNSSLSYLDPNYPTQILLDIRLSFLQVPYQNTFYTQWRNYVCGALRQDIEWRPHPFPSPFFPSLSSPPNSSTSFPSLSPSLPSLPLEVGPLKSN